MNVLIVGLGSIGQRHLVNLRRIDPTTQVTVWHLHSQSHIQVKDLLLVNNVVYRLDEALKTNPDVALITCPASVHVETALSLAQRGVHLFIEKPLSDSFDGVDNLLHICREHRLVLMVGYNFRFYPPLQIMHKALEDGRIGRPLALRAEVGQYLPEWRPGKDYRQCVSSKKELGGGVVLELSHELDYVRWLMGEIKAVGAQIGKLSDLEINVEDLAEITLQLTNGAIASVHLNMIQQPASRNCRIIGTAGTLMWDGIKHHVQIFSAASQAWEDLHANEALDHNDMYAAELQHFFDCVKGNSQPVANAAEARRVLEIALAVKQSFQEQRVITL